MKGRDSMLCPVCGRRATHRGDKYAVRGRAIRIEIGVVCLCCYVEWWSANPIAPRLPFCAAELYGGVAKAGHGWDGPYPPPKTLAGRLRKPTRAHW